MFDRLVEHLTSRGDDTAVLTAQRRLTYREVADEVAARASELGSRRRLVLLYARNDVDTLMSYLAALAGHHVVLPLPAGSDADAVIYAYAPDVIVGDGAVEHRHRPTHRMHPELALLLSTSGSTGSPKLVRLSTTNLAANAEAIATYLDIRHTDRAATTLPMSYCYGLSVVHSHLLRGAGLILTDRSVVDDEFWDLMNVHRGTSFAGVPHTFDLLDRIGFDDMALPHLRYVSQAGGRLAPDRVRRFAALGRRQGWQFFVMYGATEATARMAYLPAELAHDNPGSIGAPIPGGTFDIEPVSGLTDDVGELVYRGPNVMMGYADGPGDLAAGRTVEVLRTGDVARRHAGGLYEVVGRISRFVKLYGLRIDLQSVEASLRADGVTAICTDGEGELFADVLHLDAATIDPLASFTDLGGNSLSYVSLSVRLERAIGHLPADWQRLPLRELESAARPRRRWGAAVETSVALRAVAIVLVVGSHAGLFSLWGGAHVLLGVAGYNFGRFCLTPLPRAQRARQLRHTIAWIAVPAVVWVAVALAVTNDYTASNLLLANKFLGHHDSMTAGRLWFVEVIVWILVVLALLCCAPIGDRLERRWPFGFALALLAVGLAMRFDGFGLGNAAWFTVLAFWFFAVGSAVAKSSAAWQRAAVTLLLGVGLVGYFGNPTRELLVFAGLALLIWLPAIRCPSAFTVVAGAIAEASLFTYLVHYQVYPLFGDDHLVGVIASLVVGLVLTQLVTKGRRRLRSRSTGTVTPAALTPVRR